MEKPPLMTSTMEYSSQDVVDVYITGDLGLGSENVPIKIYDSDEETHIRIDDIYQECKVGKGEPTVYITELPKGINHVQELKIPSKSMESDLLLGQMETDSKGNSIVTIQVPLEGFVSSEGEENIQSVDLEEPENNSEINDINDAGHSKKSTGKTNVNINRGEFVITGGENFVIKPSVPQKIRSRVPIWKRHTPKPPGFISNYLYPHGVRSIRSRVIIDCPTNIPVPEFKAQLADTSDIVTTLDVAPATKRKIRELTTNSVSKLFAYPGKPLPCKRLYTLYHRHLTSQPQTHELPDDLELMPVGYSPTIDYSQVKRITRKRKTPDSAAGTELEMQAQQKQQQQSAGINIESDKYIVQSMMPITDQIVRVLIKPGVVGVEEQEILVLHDGSDTLEGSASLQHSIEVLLAAAESGEIGKEPQQVEQVFICNEGTYDENDTDPFMTEQIIIVQNDVEDDEMCGQVIETS